tara:strand:- start:8345 stop:8467 length:123 start_codon:yes stop_codon:yes gene_type:complete
MYNIVPLDVVVNALHPEADVVLTMDVPLLSIGDGLLESQK